MEIFKALNEYYRDERKTIALAVLCLTLNTALGLVYPQLLRYLIDVVIGENRYGQVPFLALFVIVLISVKALFGFLYGHIGGRAGNRVALRLRNALYRKLQNLSFTFYDRSKTGDLMSKLTADLEQFRHFVAWEFGHFINFCSCIILGSLFMITINWQLTLIAMVTMPVIGFMAVRFQDRIHPAFRSIREALSRMTSAAQENISGVRTVKSFGRESFEVEKFSERNRLYQDKNIETAYIWSRYFPAMEMTANLSLVILMGAGGYLALHKMLTIGELVAFFGMIGFIIGPLWSLGYHINVYTQTKAAAERLVDLLQQYEHIRNKPDALAVPEDGFRGHVRFEEVSFSYDGVHQVLNGLNLDAPPGHIVGMLGGTGSGKTTAVLLLIRAYSVKTGLLTIDGKKLEDYRLEQLRERMAVVFQETFLFSATIWDNIAYGLNEATMEQIIAAAKLAQAHDFITELPAGYDTVVGERGLGLSGGQKQRIAIARALIRKPRILILDDATSAVDMETEHEIQMGLRTLRGTTVFIIAHRISSLQHADEILVLEEGTTVQRGTHAELLGKPGPYRETYRIQYADYLDDQQAEAKGGLYDESTEARRDQASPA
ncbi:ABC transporter ATP-binding protein [Paenibacillus aurantius]|uniref:ABC transporter ATP-binding protein n=1 Tax=Paenibacillus aurantius TaxID=2918900 RepID=A0AA96LIE9_9BACL|nr:ABC transporter ATP-binding protein [Paenibacillus aurantius]WNQ13894.1 ABC transporter ATP-binding protein [Paenibacillus aurantius]